MRAPLSWLRQHVELSETITGREVAEALIRVGFEVERVEHYGDELSGVVVGKVLAIEELTEFKKPIRLCQVSDGTQTLSVICGARNFAVGDHIAWVQPGGVLPGGFEVSARETYGHVSNGMICSVKELGIGEDHAGILVLSEDTALGTPIVDLLGLRDEVLDIAVTADRGYALSIRGLAREAGIALGVPFHDRAVVPALDYSGGYPVTIEGNRCDRYVARIVEGVDGATPSPLWLQRRLQLCGVRSISVPVDITNMVMLGLGQPLHAFDADRIRGPIDVRLAKPGETLVTLDGAERSLHPEDLVIADDSGPIALAGVMGGLETEVTGDTTRVLIEAAHFDPISIAKTARRHKLPSEASKRFERGVDPALAPAAAHAAVTLFEQILGVQPALGVTDVGTLPIPPTITMPIGMPERVAGRPYDADRIVELLTQLGCIVEPRGQVGTAEILKVLVPSWRPDLTGPQELVEEVLRLEGLETIPSVLPQIPAGRGLTPTQRLRRTVQRALAGAGCVEVLSFPFVSEDALLKLGLEAQDPRRALTTLANPLTEAEPSLRTTLLPGLFATALRNLGRGASDLALFEHGIVFLDPSEAVVESPPILHRPSNDELRALNAAIPAQPRYLAGVLTGKRERDGWWGPGRAATWADAVSMPSVAADAIGVKLTAAQASIAPWHPGRCAALTVQDAVIGYAGELHPRVIAAFGLPAGTCAFELDLDALVTAGVGAVPAPDIASFPPATQDVALVVELGVPAGEVESALREGAGELLEDVRLFDVFEGEQVGAGRKSLAFAMRFRASDRTLTADEASAARDAAVRLAAERTGATQRT